MNENIIEKQLKEINKAWEEIKELTSPQLEEKLRVVHDFTLSLLLPVKFTSKARKNLLTLADKLGYKPNDFKSWWEIQKSLLLKTKEE